MGNIQSFRGLIGTVLHGNAQPNDSLVYNIAFDDTPPLNEIMTITK